MDELLITFNPSRQTEYCQPQNTERLLLGKAPSLNLVRMAYGMECVTTFLEVQINDLVNYLGDQGKTNKDMIIQTASVIALQYGYLKLTEVMLFMVMVKAGHFGTVYGNANGLHITLALRQFLHWRGREIEKIEMLRHNNDNP